MNPQQIANVKQHGSKLVMYDSVGNQIGFSVPAEDGLYNFTGETVSVRKGNMVITYDRLGNKKGFPVQIR